MLLPQKVKPGRVPENGTKTVVRHTTRDESGNDREDVARGEDEVLLAGVLDLGAAVLAVDDLVADADVERNAVAVVVDATRTDAQDLALLGLLLGGVRDDQAGSRGLLGLEGLDDDAVLEGLDVDRHDADLHFLALRCMGWSTSGACGSGTPSRGSHWSQALAHSPGECQSETSTLAN